MAKTGNWGQLGFFASFGIYSEDEHMGGEGGGHLFFMLLDVVYAQQKDVLHSTKGCCSSCS